MVQKRIELCAVNNANRVKYTINVFEQIYIPTRNANILYIHVHVVVVN